MRLTTYYIVTAVAVGLLQASCTVVSDEVSSNNQALSSTVEANEIVADFRRFEPQLSATESDASVANNNPAAKAHAKQIVDAALGAGAFERYRLADTAQGYFTNTEQAQSLHIIVNRKVTAASKKVTPSILVIFQNEKPITQFIPDKASYQEIASVFDSDTDGLNEVLLTATAYQMGSQFVAADLYGFKNTTEQLIQELGVVYENACDSETADAQQVQASVLFSKKNSNELLAERYIAPCENSTAVTPSELFTKQ